MHLEIYGHVHSTQPRRGDITACLCLDWPSQPLTGAGRCPQRTSRAQPPRRRHTTRVCATCSVRRCCPPLAPLHNPALERRIALRSPAVHVWQVRVLAQQAAELVTGPVSVVSHHQPRVGWVGQYAVVPVLSRRLEGGDERHGEVWCVVLAVVRIVGVGCDEEWSSEVRRCCVSGVRRTSLK